MNMDDADQDLTAFLENHLIPGWLDRFSDLLSRRAEALVRSPLYQNNPVLAYFLEHGVEFFILKVRQQNQQNVQIENFELIVQHSLIMSSGDQTSYFQILHPKCRNSNGSLLCVRVPYYADLAAAETQMDKIRVTEGAIDRLRAQHMLPKISVEKQHFYFNDECCIEQQWSNGMTEVANTPWQTGHHIVKRRDAMLAHLMRTAPDNTLQTNKGFALSCAFHDYINTYFLTHLFFGYHGQYRSLDDIAWIAARTINAGVMPREFDTDPPRNMKLIVIKHPEGIHSRYAYINRSFFDLLSSECKFYFDSESATWKAQFQHVDEHGEAFFMQSWLLHLTEKSKVKPEVLRAVQAGMTAVEDELRGKGDRDPLVVFACEDAIRSEHKYTVHTIEELAAGGLDHIRAVTVPIYCMMM